MSLVGLSLFLLTRTTLRYSVVDLGSLPGLPMSQATAINNLARIVGASGAGDLESNHAFLWQDGRLIDLTKKGLPGSARAINDKGEVVGKKTHGISHSYSYVHSRWFRWRAGKLTLQRRDDRLGSVCGINDRGDVVGCADSGQVEEDGSTQYRAFLAKGASIADLNTRIAPHSGWILLEANGINNRGEIVGFGRHNGRNRAFLLRPMGRSPRTLPRERHPA